jgi:RimJ/RimL family protein N-acetyltransferase
VVSVVLRPISAAAASAVLEGRHPSDVQVADDCPTEFSHGIARQAGGASPLGPFYIHRASDDIVVGEIGGGFVGPGVAEIGYAIVSSCRGRGYATDAVRQLIEIARATPAIDRVIAHTPLDRPASGRVVANAGMHAAGEVNDEHQGAIMRVTRWEIAFDR